jgi:hypothetical protein
MVKARARRGISEITEDSIAPGTEGMHRDAKRCALSRRAAQSWPGAGRSEVMDITDCPHRAGTREHSEWVRNVYIPAVEDERALTDSREHGAASIGRVLIRGGLRDADAGIAGDVGDLGRLFVRVA